LLGEFEEYREPFAGGASVFFHLFHLYGDKKKYWINDIFHDLYVFYTHLMFDHQNLIKKIREYKEKFENGKDLYYYIKKNEQTPVGVDRAAFFFIMNRITFSGVSYCGGYSQQSYETRFTESSILRLEDAAIPCKHMQCTCLDYSKLMQSPSLYGIKNEDIVIYLDPPYDLGNKASKLYGDHGDLHRGFNFEEFADTFSKCKFRCLVSMNNTEEIRSLFKNANIFEFEKYHSMKYGGIGDHKVGKELLISNYDFPNI
jgi:DNA adenine methylase